MDFTTQLNRLLAMTTEAEFLSAYEGIKSGHKSLLRQIDTAIAEEEHERPLQAIAAYECCLRSIDAIFAISVGLPDNIDAVEAEWADACTIIQKVKSAQTELTYRLKVLRAEHAPVDGAAVEAADCKDIDAEEPEAKKKSVLAENPPTYYDIENATGQPKTYREIIRGLRDMMAIKECDVTYDTLFQSQTKLYKIQPNGDVSTLAGETSMSLVMCTVGGAWQFLNGVCFIQCVIPQAVQPDNMADKETADGAAAGTSSNSTRQNMVWVYPLIPLVTTCFRTDYGAFIFPDLESDVPGATFGLLITDPTASPGEEEEEELTDLQQFFLDLLEAVLAGTVEQLKQPVGERVQYDTSEEVSRHLVTAGDFIARNLVRGAEKTGELMVKSTPYIISKMRPAPADTPPVCTAVSTSVEVAKTVTYAAAGITGWVAGKVGSASMALGRFLAPHIQTHGATLLEKGFGYDINEANSKMEGALTIAAGAVEGFTTAYNGLETSAKILGNNLSENSVKIIEHKYGPSAGNVAAGTFDTIGNAFNVSQNVNYITPKGIAKKMAKNTGKAVVIDYKRNLRTESQYVNAGSLYPDLRKLKDKSLA